MGCGCEARNLGHLCLLPTQVFERAEVGKALNIHITLTNTLMVPLNNCAMVLEGSGLINGQMTKE